MSRLMVGMSLLVRQWGLLYQTVLNPGHLTGLLFIRTKGYKIMAKLTYRIFYENGAYVARIYSGADLINQKGGFLNMVLAEAWAKSQI